LIGDCLVELLAHQAPKPLDDVRPQPELPQCVCGLEAEQTTPDHHPRRTISRIVRVGANRVEVVERAVDVTVGQVVAGHRRDEGMRTGGEYQGVVGDTAAQQRRHAFRGRIDPRDWVAKDQLDAAVAGVVIAWQRKPAAVPMLGVAGRADAVVGGVAFLGENSHPPNALAVPGPARPRRNGVRPSRARPRRHVSASAWPPTLGSRHFGHVASRESPVAVCSPGGRAPCEKALRPRRSTATTTSTISATEAAPAAHVTPR
jgi:hypothetical protein